MNISEYLENKKQLYEKIIEFIDEEDIAENCFDNIIKILNDFNLGKDQTELGSFLSLISSISNNHYRSQLFFKKIEFILLHFKDQIKQHFSNFRIFNIFKNNKKLLYFFFKEKLITPDKSIYNIISQKQYIQKNYLNYFWTEFQPFFNDELRQKIESQNKEYIERGDFEECRNIGENDSMICELIRNDKVEDFIALVNRKNYSLSSTINSSIFETNPFLILKKPTLIEYAAFFGSIQIFTYLKIQKVKLTQDLWLYSIHGKNPNIIHMLEDNHVESNDQLFNQCFIESITCHNNDSAKYIQDVLIDLDLNQNQIIKEVLKSYNYPYFPDNLNCKYIFYQLF